MPDKRSRSEIETALSGKQKLHKRKISSYGAHDDLELDSHSPRRQQVIGGDLTGVSGRRRKKSVYRRLSDMHLANWVAVIVVLCIAIAFFWPHGNTESIREVAEQNVQPEIEAFYTESRIDEPEQAEEASLSFSRANDLHRANEYRVEEQLQAQIDELLSKAEQQIANNRYTIPDGNNALHSYREILKLKPDSTDAQEGVNAIKDHFLQLGQEALNDNSETRATSALTSLSKVDTESAEYTTLSTEIRAWQTRNQITDLLAKAKEARANDRLILPADESSLYFYKQVLSLDSDNSAAKDGIKGVADTYINRANQALIRGDLDAATGYLATASVVDARHPSIDIVRNMIAKAEPIAALTSNNTPQLTPPIESQNPVPPIQNRQISDIRTPPTQADEQAQFDQVYLDQGLDAYYRGDYDAAAGLLQPLADKGISRAQFRIGYMHYLGRGFPENSSEADRILRAALPAVQNFANEGRSWAQSDLGSLYEDGLVLPRDYAEAVYWYRSAAEQGYAGAQTNLGIMYAQGRGVTQSRQTAIEWFQRAAEQGDIAAQRNLESLGVE